MTQSRQVMAEGERVARVSFFTLVCIGVVELIAGLVSGSLTLTTDAADSFSDAVISFIVWAGLRYSRRAPDSRFHFGYLRVESLAALIASLAMVAAATAFMYEAYLRLLRPHSIAYEPVALAVLLAAGVVSLHESLRMRHMAKASNLVSLRTGAYNSIKGTSASFVGLGTLVVLVVLDLPVLDAVGSIIIGAYIYTVAYISIRESSLVLVDAFSNPEVVSKVKETIEGKYGLEVESVRLRRVGPLIEGIIYVLAAGTATLDDVSEARMQLKKELAQEIDGLGRLTILFHTRSEKEVV